MEMGQGRYKFLCPFDDHKETEPSFVVYTLGKREDFYCFGCKAAGCLVHLVERLDNISFKSALEKLSDGIVVSPEDDLKFILDRIRKETGNEKDVDELSHSLLEASSQCFLYSAGVDFDENEMKFIDRYYSFLDEQLANVDFDNITESIVYLPEALSKRKELFGRKTEEKRKKEHNVERN